MIRGYPHVPSVAPGKRLAPHVATEWPQVPANGSEPAPGRITRNVLDRLLRA
jgi:hypothetical protein